MVPNDGYMQPLSPNTFQRELNRPTTMADIFPGLINPDNAQPNWQTAEYQDDGSGMAFPPAPQHGELTQAELDLLDPAMFQPHPDLTNTTALSGTTAAGLAPASLAHGAPGGQPADGALHESSSSHTVTPGPGADQDAFPGSA